MGCHLGLSSQAKPGGGGVKSAHGVGGWRVSECRGGCPYPPVPTGIFHSPQITVALGFFKVLGKMEKKGRNSGVSK